MYFADETDYTYTNKIPLNGINIGWLEPPNLESKVFGKIGGLSLLEVTNFLTRHKLVNKCLGHHICGFCHTASGNGEIWISTGLKTFVCPALLPHYMAIHGYCPPQQFCEAVEWQITRKILKNIWRDYRRVGMSFESLKNKIMTLQLHRRLILAMEAGTRPAVVDVKAESEALEIESCQE